MASSATISENTRARKAKSKFRYYFRHGFSDEKYYDWERGYKEEAHKAWELQLNKQAFGQLLKKKEYAAIAAIATRIESKTNLLFSFEKMAMRDAVKSTQGARLFAQGLYEFLYTQAPLPERFDQYVSVLGRLPRKQTRVLTWPVTTVFPFIADPVNHIFLKPRVTQAAAVFYHYPFEYSSKVRWDTYKSLLDFAVMIKKDLRDWKPKDMIDIQSFIWVLGSDEYPDTV